MARQIPRSVVIGLACLFLAIWFGALDSRELFHPDEGRYAAIPHEMLASGDWITPRLNGLKYFEKPALQYWITAATFWVLGEQEWTARLWPALSGLVTLLLVFYTGRRIADAGAGFMAAALLASTFQFFVFSQVLTLDMGLTFFMTLALSAFIASQDIRVPTQRKNWAALAGAAMGLAVLSKGLIGVVLPALVLVTYIVLQREWRLVGRLSLVPMVIAFLTVALPWFVWVQLRNPEFFQFFFIREHFGRFALNQHHRPGVWYYFLGVLLIGALPWSFAYLKALVRSWRRPLPGQYGINPDRLLVLWVVIIVAFFSLSSSKLPGYILPVFPALALLLGCRLQSGEMRLSSWYLFGLGTSGIAIALGAPYITQIPKFVKDADLIAPYVPWAVAGGCTLVATAWLAWFAMRRNQRFTLPAMAFGSLFSFQVMVTGTEAVENRFSTEDLIEVALTKIGDFDPAAPFYSVGMYDQTLVHHVKRTLTLVTHQDEFAMGIALEPELFVANMSDFRDRWRAQQQAYAIITPSAFAQEQTVGTPMHILASNRRAVIIAREEPTDANRRPQRPDQ